MIIAIGFKVNNERAVQFHKWANKIVKDYTIKGFTIDDERFKRVDSKKENMGLTTWEDSPNEGIQKFDVIIAKNYLTAEEINFLNRLVTMYLDYAEIQALNKIPMTMQDWASKLNSFIEFNGKEILMTSGKISYEQAKLHAETEFEKYRIIQDRLYQSDFNKFLLNNELPKITKEVDHE